ncbi:DnaJ-like subfamily C member 10 [Porphyridium purpureum]|uniref:DnaJ-like subfamily C member 10 n=1 Tax=Porphyridium purpureum TaxID=35688 RepID=A0A5J4YQK0_PORPP|nr:DnaJ-like subfamily C member 10 [Porphyridium purpureum]|eukprot:POR9738..scf236_6
MCDESYYDVLGVSADASDEQIRKRFLELALRLHPDKQRQRLCAAMRHGGNQRQTADGLASELVVLGGKQEDVENVEEAQYCGDAAARFERVLAAHRVLSDPVLRLEYDHVLRRASSGVVAEVRSVHEMEQSEAATMWSTECHCGGMYCLPAHEVYTDVSGTQRNAVGVVLPCDTCSRLIQIMF